MNERMLKFGMFCFFVFILCWAAWLGAQAKDIYEHGFIECYETTTFNTTEFLCVKKGE